MSKLNVIAKIAWSILGCVAVIMIGSMFYPQYKQYLELQEREAAMELEYRHEAEKLKLLKSNQEKMNSDAEFVERVAREEVGFAKPGETVVKFVEDQRAQLAPHESARSREIR